MTPRRIRGACYNQKHDRNRPVTTGSYPARALQSGLTICGLPAKAWQRGMSMLKINIKTGLTIFGIVFAIGFASVVYASHLALTTLKVGGPVYSQISLGKDLVADILPPPEYILES